MSTGTMETYDLVGVAEDVSDIITNISPTQTPFLTMIGSEKCHNTIPHWQEDSLQAVAQVALVEGANAPTAAWQATVMRNNTTQILGATAQASRTADVVKKYGRGKELAYQLMLRGKELKRALEYALVGTGQSLVAGNDSTARKMAGYQAQISSGTTDTLGSQAVLTEALIVPMLQALYTNGADPDTILVKPSDGPRIAAFQESGGRSFFSKNGDRKLVNAVDVYETSFGKVSVILDRFIRGANTGDSQSDAMIFEKDMWKLLTLRNWQRITLAVTGDATQVELVGEFSLKHRNQAASAIISNLTPLT